MTRLIRLLLLASLALLSPPGAQAVTVGSAAPDFTATDTYGKARRLSDYKSKFVVLEWQNRECPKRCGVRQPATPPNGWPLQMRNRREHYTRKHHSSQNMQNVQREWTAKGVVWFTVISSAPGEQGYVTAEEENAYVEQAKASPTPSYSIPPGSWAISIRQRQHRTCSSLIRRAC